MKRRAIECSVLVVLFLVSVFPMSILSGGVDFHGGSRFSGSQSAVDWWPMFHHDLTHSGYSASTAPNTNQTVWNYTTGGLVDSSPAVVDGRVYVGSTDSNVYALNASTGAQVWNYTTANAVHSSPAVADGMVFAGSTDHNVYALNASTGAFVWNYTTGDSVDYSSPAVTGGQVFVGSLDGKVYALNASTGAPIWSFQTGGGLHSSPAVADGMVFAGSWDDRVYGLNVATGAQVWNYTTSDQVWSSPAVADGLVYVGSDDGNVYGLNVSTGALIWNYTIGGSVWSSPAVAYGMVFAGSDKVYALNATTGAYIWNCTTGGLVDSSPAVADGKIFVGSRDHNVYALNASTGTPIWHYATGDIVASSPAVADGKVFAGSLDGKVYAFGPLPIVQTFSVSFTESGLPSGMEWWVDLNGDNRSSDLSMIRFSLPSGTYAYSAGALGYSASPSADSVTVNGTNTNKQVTFTHIPEFPSLLILSPENGTFNASDVPLTFTVDMPTSWIGYSLDGGASTTIAGNDTIAVLEGFHNVVVYANSTADNMSASPKVYFTVDVTPPEIVKVSQDPPTASVLHDQEVIISVNATDLISGVKSVRLTYSTNNSALTLDSPMAFNRAYGLWQYTIWGQQPDTLVKYKITAYDNAGNSMTDDNTGQYYVYTVVIPEFPTVLVPALFMAVTLLVATILQKRENFKKRENRRLQRLLAGA